MDNITLSVLVWFVLSFGCLGAMALIVVVIIYLVSRPKQSSNPPTQTMSISQHVQKEDTVTNPLKHHKEVPPESREEQLPIVSGEWEYHTIENTAPKGKYFDVVVGADTTREASARLTLWYKAQAMIMQEVQKWLDGGWEPIGEIGPGCLILTTSAEHSKGCLATIFGMSALGYNWWLTGIRIPLRRRVKPGTVKSFFDVVLVSSGSQKIEVIKVIRQLTDFGLGEAKNLSESSGSIILRDVPKSVADTAKTKLQAVGATVQLR